MRNYLILPILCLILISCGPITRQTIPAQSAASSPFHTLFQTERSKRGLDPIRPNTALQQAAQSHADDMLQRGYFDHTSPSGRTMVDRATAANYCYSYLSENIAKGQPDAATVLHSWMTSPGHRANMLNRKTRDYGLARAGELWVLAMGQPC